MALVSCSECGSQVSDKAHACPKCGAPVSLSVPEHNLKAFRPSLLGTDPGRALLWGVVGLVTCGLGWLVLIPWWVELLTTRLVVSNKRVTLTRGVFTKRTSEVMLAHIRNVTVRQRPSQQMFSAGDVGISSSGQSDVCLLYTSDAADE